MRLRRIELPGFGCLREFSSEFAPGINVVFGMNEAGKSTLQQAICAMLYGFYDGERGKPDEKRRHERFRPWAEGAVSCPYRGVLEYELENGERYEVRRDFSSPDVPTQLIDLALGTDVAASYGMGRHGNVPFARRQLGMSRSVFQSCAFIAQGEIFEVSQGASPREIGDAIAAMADSARRDVSAAAALSRLDGLMLRIGGDRARTAELPKARENLRAAEAELAALDAARAGVAERSAQLDGTRGRLEALKREITATQVRYLVARRRSLTRLLDELGEVENRLETVTAERERVSAYESFPSHLRDRVVALADRRRRALVRLEPARTDLGVRRDAVGDNDRLEFEALRVSVGALSGDSIEEAARVACAVPEAPSHRGRLRRVLRALAAALRSLWRRVFGGPDTDAEEVDALAGMDTVAATVTREEALELLERHRRYVTLKPAVDALEAAQARVRDDEEALSSADGELTELLTPRDGGTDEAVAAFLDGCDKRAEHDAAVAALRECDQRREMLLGGRAAEDLERLLAECRQRLDEMLEAHPELEVEDGGERTSEIEAQLAELKERRHEVELAAVRLEEEVRAAFGDQRSRADIEEDVERWRRETVRLERLRSSAQMAREVINEAMTAVYRDFAPAVSSFLSDGFAHVTEGRYKRAHVDPATLEVSLLLPETHQVIKDPPVSRGTLALAYVLMRIGLAQHMSAVSEPVPLVLDDPFVDLDDRRLELMLEFATGLSGRMQVLLFTKEAGILRWLEANATGEAHRVHMLSRRKPAPAAV